MTATSREERYAEVASREIEAGEVREPQWSHSVIHSGNDPIAAMELYVANRVSEMADYEAEYAAAEEQLRKLRQRYNDYPHLPLDWHNGLLIAILFIFALLWVASWLLENP
jgi:hypothetical protein